MALSSVLGRLRGFKILVLAFFLFSWCTSTKKLGSQVGKKTIKYQTQRVTKWVLVYATFQAMKTKKTRFGLMPYLLPPAQLMIVFSTHLSPSPLKALVHYLFPTFLWLIPFFCMTNTRELPPYHWLLLRLLKFFCSQLNLQQAPQPHEISLLFLNLRNKHNPNPIHQSILCAAKSKEKMIAQQSFFRGLGKVCNSL